MTTASGWLLTDASGFPLMVQALEGNKAETTTTVPAIQAFAVAHQLPDVTVVADAGMVSAGNQKAIEDAGLSFILRARIPDVPYVVAQSRREHPGQEIPDGHVFTQPWPTGPADKHRDQVIYYQYKADRARRTLRGIDEQVAGAEKAVARSTTPRSRCCGRGGRPGGRGDQPRRGDGAAADRQVRRPVGAGGLL